MSYITTRTGVAGEIRRNSSPVSLVLLPQSPTLPVSPNTDRWIFEVICDFCERGRPS